MSSIKSRRKRRARLRASRDRGPWIFLYTPPDLEGRRSYRLSWVSDYHPGHPSGEHRIALRHQQFYADPEQNGHIKLPPFAYQFVEVAMRHLQRQRPELPIDFESLTA